MSQIVAFFVAGIPAPKGSAKGYAYRQKRTGKWRAAVTHDNPRTKPWQAVVQYAAQMNFPYRPEFVGPVKVDMTFYLPKPKRAKKSAMIPTKKPDLDKLIRCTLDALKGILYRDDAQVAQITAFKFYNMPVRRVGGGAGPGVDIEIEPIIEVEE